MLYFVLLARCSVLLSAVVVVQTTYLRSRDAQSRSVVSQYGQQPRSMAAEFRDMKDDLDALKINKVNKDIDGQGTGDQALIGQMANDQQTLESRVSSLVAELNDIKRILQTNGGLDRTSTGSTTYIRWGRTTCPATTGAQRVYKGYAAGSFYTQTGGGSNYVCVTDDPQWEYTQEEFNNRGPQGMAQIYGSEYQASWPFKADNINGGTVHDQNVPCALCDTKGQVAMIPGTFRCPAGWREEYHGYLTASHHTQAKSYDFVCIDGHPEAVQGGSANTNGALFYYTASKCGALPCPPYTQDREVTCVVCSK